MTLDFLAIKLHFRTDYLLSYKTAFTLFLIFRYEFIIKLTQQNKNEPLKAVIKSSIFVQIGVTLRGCLWHNQNKFRSLLIFFSFKNSARSLFSLFNAKLLNWIFCWRLVFLSKFVQNFCTVYKAKGDQYVLSLES